MLRGKGGTRAYFLSTYAFLILYLGELSLSYIDSNEGGTKGSNDCGGECVVDIMQSDRLTISRILGTLITWLRKPCVGA